MTQKSLWFLALLIACKPATPAASDADIAVDATVDTTSTSEQAALERLGVPKGAKRVLILSQSSHLDIDWQKTFDNYYAMFVETAFTQAHDLLTNNSRARYSVAEMAFLRHHLTQHPEQLAGFQAAAKRGALHVVGGGMTSPDTLLPETELLVRDFLYGLQFSEDVLGVTPVSAWLPDSFGHSGATPDLLTAVGIRNVAFSRIDGGPTIGQMINGQAANYPLADSLAARLAGVGADFLWQGPQGGVVLAHYLAGYGLYCQGDDIDYDEPLQIPGGHLGEFKGDDTAFTDARIDRYIAELTPYAKTPYLFVPVGCDFQAPKPRLMEYADGYNQRRYPQTGVWVVTATFDDYAELVWPHASELPTVKDEISPVYMGYLGTRADVKRGIRDAARPFLTAEPFAALLAADVTAAWQTAEDAWRLLTRTDHHDFVPGTCADDVVKNEQMPMLADLKSKGDAFLQATADAMAQHLPAHGDALASVLLLNASPLASTGAATVSVPKTVAKWPFHGRVATATIGLDRLADTPEATLVRLAQPTPAWGWSVVDLLPGDATPTTPVETPLTLVLQDATGQTSDAGHATQVTIHGPGDQQATWQRVAGAWTLVRADVGGNAIGGPSMQLHDRADDGGLWRMGHEMPGCSVTDLPAPVTASELLEIIEQTPDLVRLRFVGATATWEVERNRWENALTLALLTGAAQGTTRTATFQLTAPTADAQLRTGWQNRTRQKLYEPTFWPATDWVQVGGFAILLRQSTGVHFAANGWLELMAARDARKEKCDALGGDGTDPGTHRLEWRIVAAPTPADGQRQAAQFARPLATVLINSTGIASPALPTTGQVLVNVDGVTAIKPATRGLGMIVRAATKPTSQSAPVDAAERPIAAPLTSSLATWRIAESP